jgi:hypothetical protein
VLQIALSHTEIFVTNFDQKYTMISMLSPACYRMVLIDSVFVLFYIVCLSLSMIFSCEWHYIGVVTRICKSMTSMNSIHALAGNTIWALRSPFLQSSCSSLVMCRCYWRIGIISSNISFVYRCHYHSSQAFTDVHWLDDDDDDAFSGHDKYKNE